MTRRLASCALRQLSHVAPRPNSPTTLLGLPPRLSRGQAHMLEMGEISGHTDVQCVLGCMYAFGEGVPVDNEKAFMYWKRAAMQVPLVGWLCWPALSQPSSLTSLTS